METDQRSAQVHPYRAVVSAQNYKERRRLAGGLVTVAAVVGGGWVSASQSFVTLHDGTLIHPSPWGWLLYVCIAIGVVGVYIALSTVWEGMLPRRMRVVDHSSMYGLAMDGINTSVIFYAHDPSKVGVNVGVVFVNGCQAIIEYEMAQMNVEIGGLTVSDPTFQTKGQRLLPGHKKTYFFPTIPNVPVSSEMDGTLTYVVTYGPPWGYPRYRRTHKVAVKLFGIDPVQNIPGRADYRDLEAETDEVINS